MSGRSDAWVAAALGLLLATAAAAQDKADPIYRCGAEGRQYSDTACPDGKPVAAADARSTDQRRQAEEVVRRDRELADRLVREREQRERNAPGAVSLGSAPAAKPPVPTATTGPKKSPRKKKRRDSTSAVKQRA